MCILKGSSLTSPSQRGSRPLDPLTLPWRIPLPGSGREKSSVFSSFDGQKQLHNHKEAWKSSSQNTMSASKGKRIWVCTPANHLSLGHILLVWTGLPWVWNCPRVPLLWCLSPAKELESYCLLSTGVRDGAVGDLVVLYTALGGLPVDLEAGGALGVDEEVGGWAPGICARD